MSDKVEVLFFLILSILCCAFQHPDLDELRDRRTADLDNDSLRCAYAGELGYYHAFRNYDSSLYYLNEALQCSGQIDNKYLTTRYFNYLGMAHAVNGLLDSSVMAFTRSADIAREASLDSTLAQSLYGLGNVYHSMGDLDSSLSYYLEALTFFEKHSYDLSANRTKSNISVVYLSLNEFDKARSMILEANEFYKEKGIEIGLRNGYQRLSSVFKHEGKLDSALYCLHLARDLAVKHNEAFALGVIDYGIGNVLFEQQKYSEARGYLESGIEKHESMKGNQEELLFTYSNLSYCYGILGDKVKSKRAMKQADALLRDSESIEYQIFYYQSKYKVDSLFSDYKSAFESHRYLLELNKSLISQEKTKQIEELQTIYDTEKNEREIAVLSQQAAIQSLEIKQKNQAIIIGLIVFFFALALAFFIVKQRTVKRQQAQTELEQRFLRSQLNPHFIFNALLAIQNFMLKNDAQQAAQYLAKFSLLMREILENSRQEFIPVSSEIEMISSYMDIHKLRLNDSFDYKIKVDEGIDPDSDTIPPMFIQPFVENAIEHGIAGLGRLGIIKLHFSKVGDHIEVVLTDNGKGLEGSSDSSKSHESLSSTIIQERMDLFNKSLEKKIKLVLANLKNENGVVSGTEVKLSIPFSYI